MTHIPWPNPQYVIFRDPYKESSAQINDRELTAHVATPPFMIAADGTPNPDSLFIVYDVTTLCGNNGAMTASKRTGYTRTGKGTYGIERHSEVPEGYKLCTNCLWRIEHEFLPFMDDEAE